MYYILEIYVVGIKLIYCENDRFLDILRNAEYVLCAYFHAVLRVD